MFESENSLLVVLLVFGLVIALPIGLYMRDQEKTTKIGTIESLIYIDAVLDYDDQTRLYFKDGSELILGGIHTDFEIGKTYTIIYRGNWTLVSFEPMGGTQQ